MLAKKKIYMQNSKACKYLIERVHKTQSPNVLSFWYMGFAEYIILQSFSDYDV